jgi:hypothetical protein
MAELGLAAPLDIPPQGETSKTSSVTDAVGRTGEGVLLGRTAFLGRAGLLGRATLRSGVAGTFALARAGLALAVTFFGEAFLGAENFFGAVFFGAIFFGAVFFGAAFLGTAFLADAFLARTGRGGDLAASISSASRKRRVRLPTNSMTLSGFSLSEARKSSRLMDRNLTLPTAFAVALRGS